MDNAIDLRNITKTFGSVTANKNVSLSLKRGEILALLVENGSGKTTALSLICGINKPYRGRVKINGQELQKIGGGQLFTR
ncbi:MAG: ATP-binding cassette domain-containing protein, partial [Clostridiales bacterium]|nr:ATP-binding cassette domain-containing protein [Clostridiales bacterium]